MRALILGLLLVIGGCSSQTAGIAVRSDTTEVRVDSYAVADDITLAEVKQRNVGGMLQGSALIISTTSTDRYWQYKFTFFDVEGFPIEVDSSNWVPLNLHGGEQRALQATANNAGAISFELVVRPATDE
ncbi:DUF1425 domain-containing protein [Ferrimonas lipolytica]|uniref:YcfL family protein n=1 Tax=Ferrimonas lipolytica TaxID=2724191 RepID=A0A6H1UAN3_9GAMM|nr:DUF1425 domain-containing protein [Ferrimonas lipolytica]QIZ76127.1 YcfL family protein [Ferrimonas lipolytica]